MKLRVNGSQPMQSVQARAELKRQLPDRTHKELKEAIAVAFKNGTSSVNGISLSRVGTRKAKEETAGVEE